MAIMTTDTRLKIRHIPPGSILSGHGEAALSTLEMLATNVCGVFHPLRYRRNFLTVLCSTPEPEYQ